MKAYLDKVLAGEPLRRNETKDILVNITKEKYNDVQIAALLAMLQMRGVTVDELLGFRDGILETGVPALLDAPRYVDIVGTGGDEKNTFNISTCSCFVVAGAGYKVAKHGNVAATSTSGASDVIRMHGVQFTNNLDVLNRSINECGFVYLHAPLFAKAMKFVAPIRKQISFPTLFNLLGPMVNPSQPACQVLGVATLDQMRLYTNVCRRLGLDFGIVNSMDGYDEISLTGDFKVSTNKLEQVFNAADFGLPFAEERDLFGGKTQEESKQIFDNVLSNQATEAQKNVVMMNAAFAITVVDQEKTLEEALEIAKESIESGKALSVLKKFIEINR